VTSLNRNFTTPDGAAITRENLTSVAVGFPCPDSNWFDASRQEKYGGIEYDELPVVCRVFIISLCPNVFEGSACADNPPRYATRVFQPFET
jgi:hypothetical protein